LLKDSSLQDSFKSAEESVLAEVFSIADEPTAVTSKENNKGELPKPQKRKKRWTNGRR